MKPLTVKQRERLYPRAAERLQDAILAVIVAGGMPITTDKRQLAKARAHITKSILPRASDDALLELTGRRRP